MSRLFALCFLSIYLGAQAPDAPESLSAKLDVSIEDTGTLRANFILTASGLLSTAYREAYIGAATGDSQNLFGDFVRTKQMLSTPLVKGAEDPAHPIEIQFPVYADDYILPIQRQASIQFSSLPPLPAIKESGELLQLGVPGVRREEITFQIPPGFAIKVESHIDETQEFARFRSDAIVESGKLVIVREWELKSATVSASNRADVDAFWRLLSADRQRSFLFRRVERSDPTEWLASVPIERANALAIRAIEQREYDAARQLLEQVTRARPNDRYAWNNLGRALAGLGKLEDAQRAYERQIQINPSDVYAYNNLALVFERQGKWTQAIENLQKQLKIHPHDRYATGNLPRALLQEHRWTELEEASANALRVQTSNAQFKLYASIARICSGKVNDIRSELDTALGARPAASSLNNAAYYLTECDRPGDVAEGYVRRALDQLRTAANSSTNGTMANAIEIQNSLSSYLDTYGWLAFKTVKFEHAIELLSAAAALAPRGEVYSHLAQAEEKAGYSDEALIAWRQATFLEPGRISQVPAESLAKIDSIPSLSLDREWYPLDVDLAASGAKLIQADRPVYFFARADSEGRVQTIRPLDSGDEPAKKLLSSLQKVSFPTVSADGVPVATVHIVRITITADGQIAAARSVGAQAVAIAGDLSPAEFPLPAPGPSPTPPVSSPSAVFEIGGDVTAPRVATKIEPLYSEQARRAKVEGTVVLRCVVGSDGVPREFHVVRSLGYGLDENAILAVSAWRFVPGMKGGETVNVISTIEVNFRLVKR